MTSSELTRHEDPLTNAPEWVKTVAHIFPVSHVVQALGGACSPFTSGSAFAWGHLGIVLAWTVFGLAVGVRRFARELEGETRTLAAA